MIKLLKLEIQIIYFLSKFNGFIPFSISTNPPKVLTNKFSTLHSFCATILFILLLAITLVWFLLNPFSFIKSDKSIIFKRVQNFQIFFLTITTTVIFIKHFAHRRKLIILANDILSIWNEMVQIFPNDKIFNSLFIKQYGCRLLNSSTQLLGIALTSLTTITSENYQNYLNILITFFALYVHSVCTIVLSFYYYGGTITGLTMYRKINETVKKMLETIDTDFHYPSQNKHSNMQKCCQTSDLLDKLSILHSEINLFIHGIKECFQFQILLSCFLTFSQLVASVS